MGATEGKADGVGGLGSEGQGTEVRPCPSLLPDAACCPGPFHGVTPARSRRLRHRAPHRSVIPARFGTLEKKPRGSQVHSHRTGEGHGRAGGTCGKSAVGWRGPAVCKSHWSVRTMVTFSLPAPGTSDLAMEVFSLGGERWGGYDWGVSVPFQLPALSSRPQGLPGPGENSVGPHPAQAG